MNTAPSRAAALEGRFVGLISGTSMDGIDAVLVEFSAGSMRTLAGATTPYPAALRERLLDAILPDARVTAEVKDFAGHVDAAVVAVPPKFHAPVTCELLAKIGRAHV